MAATVTKFTLLRRSPRVTHREFSEHWRMVHGPLAASLPEFWKYNTRYVQNHPITPDGPPPDDPPWDGIAQTDQRPRDDMNVSLYGEPIFMQVIRPDELKFLAIDQSLVVFGRQHVILDGPREGLKMLAFIKHPEHWSLQRFHEHWLQVHAPLVQSVAPFWRRVTRYVQYHGIPELSRSLLVAGPVASFTGIGEIWFHSQDDARAAFSEPGCLQHIRPDEKRMAAPGSLRLAVSEHDIRA